MACHRSVPPAGPKSAEADEHMDQTHERVSMSFKEHDRKTFIVDTACDFAARRISKREFLRRTALAGVGFSAFAAGLLGHTRPFRGHLSLLGDEALADTAPDMAKWL